MFQLPSAKGDRTLHYVNLNRYQREGKPAEWMLGKFWQIDVELYEYALDELPPLYCSGGFRCCEHLTGDIAATYIEVADDYWCGYTDRIGTPPWKLLNHIRRLT